MKFETGGVALKGHRVIVVEDDETLRILMSDIITELGAECLAFDNADDALIDLLELHGEWSLLIADHGLPGSIKGLEFLSMAQEKWPGIPAILASGFVLDDSEQKAGNVYLFKPWSLEEFIAAIGQALALSAVKGQR